MLLVAAASLSFLSRMQNICTTPDTIDSEKMRKYDWLYCTGIVANACMHETADAYYYLASEYIVAKYTSQFASQPFSTFQSKFVQSKSRAFPWPLQLFRMQTMQNKFSCLCWPISESITFEFAHCLKKSSTQIVHLAIENWYDLFYLRHTLRSW